MNGIVDRDQSHDIDFFKSYTKSLYEYLVNIDHGSVNDILNCFLTCRKRKKTIFFAGNGGSASTAAHFAQDLGEVGRKAGKEGFKTQSLTDNVSLITAIGNDYSYGSIFSIQVEDKLGEGDVLVVISASGNSVNVINALHSAKKVGATTVGFVGFDGGKMADMCDYLLHVKTKQGEYGPVEDVHMVMDHMLTLYLTGYLKKN